jgi:hypothetical protein
LRFIRRRSYAVGATHRVSRSTRLAELPATCRLYRPRRPTASPLYRLLHDHFDRFRGVYDDGFEHRWGRWRRVADEVVGKYFECGVLEAGTMRVRCGKCRAEYVLP